MTDVVIKIMVELLSVLALASKQIKQGRLGECALRFQMYIARRSMFHSEIYKKATWRERD